MSDSKRHNRIIASDYRQTAQEYRRFARLLLRHGDRWGHRTWMHDAIRAWGNFKHFYRKAAQ